MLKKGSGKILNTASIRGLPHTGRQEIMPYSAAKAAGIHFTRILGKELAPKAQVNAVVPGFVYTSSYDSMPGNLKRQLIENTFLKKWSLMLASP